MRVLIAEEHEAFRGQLARVLESHGVVEAVGRDEAIEALAADRFDLVVCGPELLERARAADPQTLVVVTTDPAADGTLGQALGAGAHDCIARASEDYIVSAVLRRAVEMVRLMRENEELLHSLKRNVEALGLQNRRLEHLATRDGLTGLFNHRYFREAFEVELSRCHRHERQLSLVLADVDYFKKYNDTQGHLAGDELLTTLGGVITRESRKSTIVARYGGEEFALLVPETDNAGALQYAEKIRGLVEAYPFEGREAHPGGKITMSLGVATYPEHGTDANALIKHADDALYRAKDAGRNLVSG